jgi:epoxyqueuosine reductase
MQDAAEAARLAAAVKARAAELGFTLAGICPAAPAAGYPRLQQWLAHGYAGEMDYFRKRLSAYEHPQHVLDGARSLVMLGLPYSGGPASTAPAGSGRVARYAWGPRDYHDVARARLHELADALQRWSPGARTRCVVDTAPLLEREFAMLAGLGWIGKHTLLLNRQQGSYFFLAALLADVELAADVPAVVDHCGTCTACLDACPTEAFPQPYVLDATRCISYLTIEHRSSVPVDLRRAMGDWLFGCDACQEACPWNRFADAQGDAEFHDRGDLNPATLGELFALSAEAFRARFRHSPLWRPRRRGLLRNAAIVLGNQRRLEALDALVLGLHDEEPLVREAAAWALGELDAESARTALHARLGAEEIDSVRREIVAALNRSAG